MRLSERGHFYEDIFSTSSLKSKQFSFSSCSKIGDTEQDTIEIDDRFLRGQWYVPGWYVAGTPESCKVGRVIRGQAVFVSWTDRVCRVIRGQAVFLLHEDQEQSQHEHKELLAEPFLTVTQSSLRSSSTLPDAQSRRAISMVSYFTTRGSVCNKHFQRLRRYCNKNRVMMRLPKLVKRAGTGASRPIARLTVSRNGHARAADGNGRAACRGRAPGRRPPAQPPAQPVALTAARSCLGDDICERAVRRFSRLLIVLCVQRTLTNAR